MKETNKPMFLNNLAFARSINRNVELSTSHQDAVSDYVQDGDRYFLDDDISNYGLLTPNCMGFIVRSNGELISLFSTKKGYGDYLVQQAIEQGATRLDCFDGYLPALYARHGFKEYDRVANWTAGQPDVVFMSL